MVMADRNINLRIRKPRKSKGTPFYTQRNYYALGVVLLGASSWIFYELWSQSKRLKKSINEGKFQYSQDIKDHITETQISIDP